LCLEITAYFIPAFGYFPGEPNSNVRKKLHFGSGACSSRLFWFLVYQIIANLRIEYRVVDLQK
jgi:hypothetical protein